MFRRSRSDGLLRDGRIPPARLGDAPATRAAVVLVAVLTATAAIVAPVGATAGSPAPVPATTDDPSNATDESNATTADEPVRTAATESEPNDAERNADNLSIGEPTTGRLDTSEDRDLYRFRAEAGQELELTTSVPNTSQGLGVEVFEQGASLAALRTGINPGAGTRSFTTGTTIRETATYFLIVDVGLNYDGQADYEITVDLDDLAPEEPNEVADNATPYTLGTNRSARRTLGDVDVYQFRAERGDQLNASLTLPNSSTGGEIAIFEAGSNIARERIGINPGSPGQGPRTVEGGDLLESTGTYYAYVDPGRNYAGEFDYSFRIDATDAGFTEPNEVPDDATRLTPNPAPGARGAVGDDDTYVFRAEAGETVSVNFTGPTPPAGETTTLFVNRETAAGDYGTQKLRLDSAGGRQSGSFTVQATGTYLVNVPTRPGSYEFDVTVDGTRLGVPNDRFETNGNLADADANASIALGTYDGLRVVDDDVDLYAVNLTAGETVVARIAADSSAGVPSLSVLAANGTVVANGSATATGREAVDTVPSNGTYYVRVAGTGGTTASYDLTVRVPTAVTVAPEPQSITARPGGNVTVDVVANGAASGVSAYDVSLATNASLATVASVDPAGAAGAGDVSVAPDGSSATLDAANLSLSASSGATTLATVTLDATNATGEDALRVTASSVVDADGVDYAVEASNGTLRVSAGPGDVGGSGGAATDPLPTRPGYEDVDGDGDFDFFDVVTFLFALDELPAETRQFFDFDADGETDFFDVISLLFRT